jgi:hypothetical protein
MKKHLFLLVILICFGASPAAHARVFNMSDSSIAAYFRGSGGLSMMGGEAYSTSSGASTYFDDKDKPLYNYSGEIGLLYQASDRVVVRLGVEGVQTREVTAPGKSSTSLGLMTVDSKALAFVPNLTLEIKLTSSPTGKSYIFLGGGYAMLKASNSYTMLAGGTSTYPGVSDYKDAVSGKGIMAQGGCGFEFLMLDNVTLATELGWRYLPIPTVTHDSAVTTVQGAVTADSTAKDGAGNDRAYDMGGPFVGISLRFYIPPLN